MARKSITRFLRHGVVYRIEYLEFNKTMVLSSKKSKSSMSLYPKLAIFDDSTMMLFDFFDDCTMVLLKSKNPI